MVICMTLIPVGQTSLVYIERLCVKIKKKECLVPACFTFRKLPKDAALRQFFNVSEMKDSFF